MRKLIHSRFELDLSNFKVSDTEENSWFTDTFFTKYSFPFEIDLEDDIDAALGFISQYNSDAVDTYHDVKYIHGDRIEDAIFEVESYQNKLSCILRFGFEQLPSFDKKLSELSLDKFDLPSGTTIYQHAETANTKIWPNTNYKFPQIHVDKYDPEDDEFSNFEKILNNRKNSSFLVNTVDTVADITYNKNIMQPLPYWLHVLQRGMIDAGYTLSGQILQDDLLKKALLYGDVDYFKQATTQDDISIIQNSEDASFKNASVHKYSSISNLATPGKYKITGSIRTMTRSNVGAFYEIKYNNQILVRNVSGGTSFWKGTTWATHDIDIEFETTAGSTSNVVAVSAQQLVTTGEVILSLNISCIRINNASGTAVPTIENEDKVDLTKAVPNVTFGEFVKVVKNWFNYDLVIKDKLAIMDRIEDQVNYENAVDLSKYEIKYPFRRFTQGASFLLKFNDVDSSEYKYDPVFQNEDTTTTSNFSTDEKTSTIEIAALPLPLTTRDGVQTAHAFEEDDSKIYLVVDFNETSGHNVSKSPFEYLIPQIHERYWKEWFTTRIFAQGFRWIFTAWWEDINTLTTKSKVFAYNRYHLVKNINKTERNPDLFDVETETITVK